MISCNMIPCTCGNCLACDICGKRAGQAHGPQHKQAHEAYERGYREGIAEGRKLERADVVAWLRKMAGLYMGGQKLGVPGAVSGAIDAATDDMKMIGEEILEFADRYEAGQHLAAKADEESK